MNKPIPVVNRIVHKRETDRNNDLLMQKLNNVKFANFTAFKIKHQPKNNYPYQQDQSKLVPLDQRHRRAKTVMNDPKVRQQNKNLYSRLVNQKATISTKSFAQQRSKQTSYLKRMGRYPYFPSNNNPQGEQNDQPQQQQHQQAMEINKYEGAKVEADPKGNSNFHTVSAHLIKNVNITSKIEEEGRKEYVIVLWSKLIQLSNTWYTVKFQRMKNHYQIQAIPYPLEKTAYFIKLLEEVGTSLLSENDYDYQYIFTRFVTCHQNRLCLSFELSHGYSTKKCFYTFQQKNLIQIRNKDTPSQRKTNFALQNELKIESNIKPSTHESVPIFKDINAQISVIHPNKS